MNFLYCSTVSQTQTKLASTWLSESLQLLMMNLVIHVGNIFKGFHSLVIYRSEMLTTYILITTLLPLVIVDTTSTASFTSVSAGISPPLQKLNGCMDLAVVILVTVLSDTKEDKSL